MAPSCLILGRNYRVAVFGSRLTVPRWMAVNLSGTYLETVIDGTTAEVAVETVHGKDHLACGADAIATGLVGAVDFILRESLCQK